MGGGNIAYLDGAEIINSTVYIRNSNSLIYAANARIQNCYQFLVSEDVCLYMGPGVTSGKCSIRVGECNLFIGPDCMFSQDIYIQNHDGHAIYDIETGSLVNPGKSIFIGKHVWIGESVSILKGSQIGSGSVIGSHSLVTNKNFPTNSVLAGVPAKVIRSGIKWERRGLQIIPKSRRDNSFVNSSKNFVFEVDDFSIWSQRIDSEILSKSLNAYEMLELIHKNNFPG